jgi:triacylglycerol lipase
MMLAGMLFLGMLADASVFEKMNVANPKQPTVTVKNGTYVGLQNSHYSLDYFLGIPFAQPPVGDLRLAPPASLNSSFTGNRNATNLQPACVQFSVCPIQGLRRFCFKTSSFKPRSPQKLIFLSGMTGCHH